MQNRKDAYGGGEVFVTPWWVTPVETRWRLLDWPGWSRLALTACYFALVNWMIFAPSDAFPDVPRFMPYADKIAHGTMFLALAWLVRWTFPGAVARGRVAGRLRFGAPAALALYACSVEVLQPLIGGAGRRFEWWDMAANAVGISCGWLLYGGAFAGRNDSSTGKWTPGTASGPPADARSPS